MKPLDWEPEAELALRSVPFFARGLVRRKVNERVAMRGGDRVTLADFREAEARFRAVSAGRPQKELEKMMPRDNEPGVELLVIESCHNKLSNCPNVLMDTDAWRQAVEDWAQRENISEKLRARVNDDKVYYHHKLRISIAGCPNGCSRPQIADLALVGAVRPEVSFADCTVCGACADACPDSAITVEGAPPMFDRSLCRGCNKCRDICPNDCIELSEPFMRVLAGGRLGRHPHLADDVGSVQSPDEFVRILDIVVNDYLDNAQPGERFADYWRRSLKHRFSNLTAQ